MDDTNNKSAPSASRVKAFRSRLSEQFRRVEAYVTDEEKSKVDAVKAELGVTTDVAVAGLIRLGLAEYERQSEAARLQDAASSHAACASAAPAARSLSVCGARLPVTAMASLAAPADFELSRMQAAAALKGHPVGTAVDKSDGTNPIARFFKTRKEISS